MQGLQYLHSKKHLHRDIKAANVLLDTDSHAALGDVGLARDLHSDSSNRKSMFMVGTPGYLDPEFAIAMTYTAHSDLFGMGIIMLELITRIPSIARGKTILERIEAFSKEGMTIEDKADPEALWPATVVKMFTKVARACSNVRRDERPTVEEVVQTVQGIAEQSLKAEHSLEDGSNQALFRRREDIDAEQQ